MSGEARSETGGVFSRQPQVEPDLNPALPGWGCAGEQRHLRQAWVLPQPGRATLDGLCHTQGAGSG